MVTVRAMNCAGDTEILMKLDLGSSRPVEIRLALMPATRTGLGPGEALVAVVVAESGPTALGVIVPRHGDPTTHDA